MCTWNHSDVYRLNTGIVNYILGVHLSWMERDIFLVLSVNNKIWFVGILLRSSSYRFPSPERFVVINVECQVLSAYVPCTVQGLTKRH